MERWIVLDVRGDTPYVAGEFPTQLAAEGCGYNVNMFVIMPTILARIESDFAAAVDAWDRRDNSLIQTVEENGDIAGANRR